MNRDEDAVAYKCVSYREEFFAGHISAGTGDAGGTDGGSFGTDWGSGDLIDAGKSREDRVFWRDFQM